MHSKCISKYQMNVQSDMLCSHEVFFYDNKTFFVDSVKYAKKISREAILEHQKLSFLHQP